MASLKLVSLNIERSLHLHLVLPFLKEQQADVVCLQELAEPDISLFEKELASRCIFAHVGNHPADPPEEGIVMTGNAIFSKFPIVHSNVEYHAGSLDDARMMVPRTMFPNCPLVTCEIQKDDESFVVCTTHSIWTPQGEPNDEQRAAIRTLFLLLENLGEFVLAGDFNAPRGGEIFGLLAEKYKDNVPPKYTTSIDGSLHRAGPLERMVDGIFSTPAYSVSDVKMVCGVSDHCALVGVVSRA